MPKVTEEHLEARRQQILSAAFACFSREGFHQTTMKDICNEAGLSPGAVYRYFDSKEEIIETSCGECQQPLALIQSAKEQGGTLEVLDQLTDFAFGMFDAPDTQAAVRVNVQLWGEALRNPRVRQAIAANINSLKEALTKIIRNAQKQGEVNPGLDPDGVARVLVSMWHGMVLQRSLEPEADIPAYVAALKAFYSGTFWQKGSGYVAGDGQQLTSGPSSIENQS